jgi:probable addiction module antidote protein
MSMRVRMTTIYLQWINSLKDRASRARIQVRVDRLVHGTLVSGGISETTAVARTSSKPRNKTKTIPYAMAAQLRTAGEMAEYLDAWLTEAPDDAAGIARALGDIARARGMTKVARDTGLSRESLYKALSEEGNPSLATVLKVAGALGLRLRASAAH